jgi:capsular polysaccharide biosynthesis protein
MRPRGEGRGEHLLAGLARLYGALMVLYPEAFRRRYEAEMRRDFSELMREGLEEGGAKELVRVWAQAHSDLVLTALMERDTTSGSRYAAYSSLDLRIAQRAAAIAMVAVVLVAMGVTGQSLLQTPTYAASAQMLVDQKRADRLIQTMTHAIDSRPVAEEAISRLGLGMETAELVDNLTVEQVESTSFIVLTYEDTDPAKAAKIVNTVGQVSSELISERSSGLTAKVYEKASVPESPVSPDPLRNGLLTLVIGLVLCAGTVVVRPGVGARVASTLGERPSRQRIGQAGLLSRRHSDYSIVERVKEKKLLRALGRRGKLTAVEASLATSLSVEEANRMLFELAAGGYLELTVEHGRLLYSFWGEHKA